MDVAIFSAHRFETPFLNAANAGRHRLRLFESTLSMNTISLAQGCAAVSLFVNDDASAPVLDALRTMGVRWLALRSAGFNHVDLKHAAELGMKVANVPEYSPYAVAEHAVALMLALNRKLVRAASRVRELNFALDGLTGFDMHGKTVGVIGTGHIGTVTARILRGFGCTILACDPAPNPELARELGMRYVDIDTLCREADIISLHVPLTPQTHYLINATRIATMKPGVMLINTSRGALVDTKAVIEALKTGHIGYLGLDVYENEKNLFFSDLSDRILQDDLIARLMTFPNVLITSHQAFLTDTALHNIAETTIGALDAWGRGEAAPHELAVDGV